jgi:anti-anti-sigma factor
VLQITVKPGSASEVTVHVLGELDMSGAARLRETLTSLINGGEVRSVGLDLRGLAFIDSTGIGTLVVAQRICADVGMRMHLIGASPVAERVLQVTGVLEALAGHQQ